ncbi:hypothetical protein C8R45DRAFT_428707 [Mycena sanguinolenta]|nr:hypothetical protein C8R45DRAFT_428707 [Mycena sanguinolenta]
METILHGIRGKLASRRSLNAFSAFVKQGDMQEWLELQNQKIEDAFRALDTQFHGRLEENIAKKERGLDEIRVAVDVMSSPIHNEPREQLDKLNIRCIVLFNVLKELSGDFRNPAVVESLHRMETILQGIRDKLHPQRSLNEFLEKQGNMQEWIYSQNQNIEDAFRTLNTQVHGKLDEIIRAQLTAIEARIAFLETQ